MSKTLQCSKRSNQRLYLLALLKSQGLSRDALHVIPTAIVLSVVTYALPSFFGLLSKGDKARLDSLFQKAFSRGFCCQTFGTNELILAADKKLFRQMSNTQHCPHPLLPNHRNSKTRKSLRNRGHNYLLSHIDSNLFENSFLTHVRFIHLICIYLVLYCVCYILIFSLLCV